MAKKYLGRDGWRLMRSAGAAAIFMFLSTAGPALAANTWAFVTDAGDSGAGSMRDQAQSAGVDGLIFNLPDGTTITLATPLDFGATNFDFNNMTSGGTLKLAGEALGGTGTLTIAGGNHFNFANALSFSGGLAAAPGTSANITLADYTGGRVVLGINIDDDPAGFYTGAFGGKLNIQGQTITSADNLHGGGLQIHHDPLDDSAGLTEIWENSVIIGNSLTVEGAADAGYTEAMGGGLYVNRIGTLAGNVQGNSAVAHPDASGSGSAYVEGGGVYAGRSIGEISGLIQSNTAFAVGGSTTGAVQAWGGGVRSGLVGDEGIQLLSGTVTNNEVIATGGTGEANTLVRGGGVSGNVWNFTGYLLSNSATAMGTVDALRSAVALGGGADLMGARTLSGDVRNNIVWASARGGLAFAGGGGLNISASSPVTITKGLYRGNRAEASGVGAVAEGGALRMDTTGSGDPARLILDPTDGDITFSGNAVAVNNEATPNAIHFGREVYYGNSSGRDAALEIKNSASNTNVVTIADGVTVDMDNGKSFTMTNASGSAFKWGGPNVFDAAGGSTVTLSGSIMFLDGFSLDHGGVNSNDNIVLNLNTGGEYSLEGNTYDPQAPQTMTFNHTTINLTSGARLKPDYGTLELGEGSIVNISGFGSRIDLASDIPFSTPVLRITGNSAVNGGTLTIGQEATLKVDAGKTLTLGAGANLSFNGGALSVGVADGNISGKIDLTANTTTAPTFSGSNLLDISEWIAGTYTVLTAGQEMAAGAPGTFSVFTVGGNALGTGMTLTPTLSGDLKSLIITAALNQDSAEKTWGGTSDTWNYTNANWLPGSSKFVLGDLAVFDGTNADDAALAVTVGGTRVETAGMSITDGSYTFSGGQIVGRTDISQGTAITPTGRLEIEGGGDIVFNNAVDFSGGLTVAGGSSANVTLADYTGGRIVLGETDAQSGGIHSGAFTGKLNIQGQTGGRWGGGLEAVNNIIITILEGSLISGNTASDIRSDALSSYAYGGGVRNTGRVSLYGTISDNVARAENNSATNFDGYASANGGALATSWLIPVLSGTVSGNLALAIIGPASIAGAEAIVDGGGVFGSGIEVLSGSVTGNKAEARAQGAGSATAEGGGLQISIKDFSGSIANNTALATATGTGSAYAYGGGMMGRPYLMTGSIFSGDISGNTVEASASGAGAKARAYGGGIYLHSVDTGLTIAGGDYTNNQAVAAGADARANGGAMFVDTSGTGNMITLDPSGKAITFSGNTITTNGATSANAIHVGRYPGNNSAGNASLLVKDTTSSGRLVTIADGITTDINNGKTFTLAQSGGNFLWGGPNLFDSAGGDTVSLTGGSMRLSNGFTLDRGTVNGGAGLLAFNVAGGNLVSEGAAASLKHTALAVSSGGKLTVDLGSTLTLDAASTFSLNGGILSFGVGAGDASGKIDMTANTTAAPTFAGSNTLDLSDWIHGTYTVLSAGQAMAAGVVDTFTAFTVGGNAINPLTMKVTAALANSDRDLQFTAALNQDSSEKVWGGTNGAWNYTDQKWGAANDQTFTLGDLAKFDGTNAGGAGLAVTVGGTAVETAGMSITDGSYTFTGGKIMGRTGISEGTAITPTGRLDIAGGGNIVFNNAVDFSGGVKVVNGSTADITFTDYTGGHIILSDSLYTPYAGRFVGKLNLQNQTLTDNSNDVYEVWGSCFTGINSAAKPLEILAGSQIKNNSLYAIGNSTNPTGAKGGGLYFSFASNIYGDISGNTASAANTGNQIVRAYGGGVYAIQSIDKIDATVTGNKISAVGEQVAEVFGGGVRALKVTEARGLIADNEAESRTPVSYSTALTVHASTAKGGGLYAEKIVTLAATITGNLASAIVESGSKMASALGGGIFTNYNYQGGTPTITKGNYSDNLASAAGLNARAEGGGLFLDTIHNGPHLVLDPTEGTITFQGNKVSVNGAERLNGIHFGRSDQTKDTDENASMIIKDSAATGNLVTIADGITTDINNGKTFTLAQSGGDFLWGGPNKFDSAGGDTVSLTGGSMRLANGFTLDRGAANATPGSLLAFNVTGGNLVSEGAAASLKHTALAVSSGGQLTVDLGSTLTLDAASTFALNGGTLSFGVGANSASGKIVSLNTTTAPTFTGANTLDISHWLHGTYTVLQAALAMNAGDLATFTAFTVGGNAIDPLTMNIGAALANGGQDLQITAALSRNNREMTWGGTSGTWNYTNQNWLDGASPAAFLPGDAARFSSAANQAVAVGGASISLSGMKITGGADHAFTGGALHIDSSTAQNLPGSVGYADDLVKEGSGTLTLATGSSTNANRIAGNVHLTDGRTILADGFTLTRTGGAGWFNVGAAGQSPILETQGAAALYGLSLNLTGNDPSLVFARAGSGLTIDGSGMSSLGRGTVAVDLNRPLNLPVFKMTGGGTLELGDPVSSSTLRLTHSGLTSQSGQWLIVDGQYTSTFGSTAIGTASLTGQLVYGTDRVLFDGAYTVVNDDPFAGSGASAPNGRKAWPGFRDAFYNRRTPFMDRLEQAYSSTAEFQAALKGMLPYMTPEGAVTQGYRGLYLNGAAANAALRYAWLSPGQVDGRGFSWPGPAPASGDGGSYGLKVFGGYFGDFASQDDRDGYSGYDADENGFLLGLSKEFDDHWTAGFYAGLSKGDTSYDRIRQDIDSDNIHAGLFARYRNGGFRLTGDLAYTNTGNDSRRVVPTYSPLGRQVMTGSFDQNIWGFGLEAAYDHATAGGWVLSPFAAARYDHLKQDGFTERGSLGLRVGGLSGDSFLTDLGLSVARDFEIGEQSALRPKLTVGWRHQWSGDRLSTRGNFIGSPVTFMTESAKQDRDGLLLGAGLDLTVQKSDAYEWGLNLGYGTDLRAHSRDQMVHGGVNIRW